MMKKIFVLYTGGTIGMCQSEHGLQPDTQLVHTALAPFSDCQFNWHICQPLIDSSAVTPQNWADWLTLVQNALPQHDGVLILHGTDTLAYTAALFALALDTQGKPIVLTGSQKPFGSNNSDAPSNLQTAIAALQRDDIHEVLLAFNGKLFPAIGCSKISTETDNGFSNAHFGEWQPENTPHIFSGCLSRQFCANISVLPIYLVPAMNLTAATHLLNTSAADAAVLMSFGHGNAPNDADFLAAIQRFTASGKLVLNISQVTQGCTAAVYAQGNALRQSGAIHGGKCNIETAIALLMLAVANQWTANEIQQELSRLKLLA
ncbi:asparaginase [Wielerella bovis]|uniref:asparaginase n=1 Tax=Wielerella bovis TaxID=2917790 RepID=UPI002018A9A5|nr:asparaginase [Wielerella bovis]ULJ63923.1 asparaginase [Wielerella bovis]ULJ68095.1 asparaginase [Wielerella bovis]ULJ68563.1 asparaginase [Wielerella bovis]